MLHGEPHAACRLTEPDARRLTRGWGGKASQLSHALRWLRWSVHRSGGCNVDIAEVRGGDALSKQGPGPLRHPGDGVRWPGEVERCTAARSSSAREWSTHKHYTFVSY